MDISVQEIEYRYVLEPPDGKKINITNIVTAASHEEMKEEIAARLSLTVKQIKHEGDWISKKLFLGSQLRVEYRLNETENWEELFRGTNYRFTGKTSSDSGLDLTIYDNLYPMAQSEDQVKINKSETVSETISKLAKKWNVPLGDVATISYAPGAELYRGDKIGYIITERLKKTRERKRGNYQLRSSKGKIHVIEEGKNEFGFIFDRDFIDSAEQDHSIENIVTRVKVFGNSDEDDQKAPVLHEVDGRTEFGIIQRVEFGAEDRADAREIASEIMEEHGRVEEKYSFSSPDLPMLRKGDLVEVALGWRGKYIVKSISRNIAQMSMNIDLERARS
ncbi:XkdQ/YqbQ family protein [Geomicrobium sediminis]|uniref:YqbQ/XkdQ domain-containing protein n=1 Tax=Geomicrobium sediminis TaxID=1347788 RepID=A0ABS2PEI9_9BACL|nr:hypothetical protein [Geomicrobium sediminis]MBM7633825.1 hypothetical protein [Geomicrobium sediminis]